MPFFVRIAARLLPLLFIGHALAASAAWPPHVQAILDQNCVKCHGPLEQEAGLELDTIEGALKGGDDGPVLAPGKPHESRLLAVIARGSKPHMPPKKQLAEEEIETLRKWIAAFENDATPEPHAAQTQAAVREIPREPSAAIDHFLAASWEARGITPAPPADDRTFVRRIFLDLAGRIPTREEAESFLFDPALEKREALVERLLASDEYARTFRETWDTLLMGRGAGRREQRRRESGWFEFLERAFKENRPWNEVVHAIITARPKEPHDRGSHWFLFERRNDHQRIAEALAPVIYGTRLDCAQCHDHALVREIKQGHYWGLVAAFNRSKNIERPAAAVGESAIGGFVNFTNLKKESQPAVIALLTGATIDEERPDAGAKEDDAESKYIDPAAKVKEPKFSRRSALANAVTRDNPLLARAFVNHTWAILMGRGIVHPVDEINSKHPPSHPKLLEWLANDFAGSGYETRRLVRAIVLSRGYQLAPGGNETVAPEAFAAAAEKPLTAETIARSLRVASGRTGEDDELRRAVAESFPDVLPRTVRATIQQAMLLTNSEHVTALFRPEPGGAVERLASLFTAEARVREAVRLALIRDPDAEELARGVEFLNAHPGPATESVGQLLWALVAGPEFLTNH